MSLKVWLPLNGTLDNQGLDDIVITNNGATIDNNGKIGKCYSFNTSNSNLTIDKKAMINFNFEASICFWIKITDWNTKYATFFQAGLGGVAWNNYIFGFLRNNGNSNCCFTISNGSSATNTNYLTPDLNLNEWYHIGLIYKTGYCLIYINGVLYQKYTTNIVPKFSDIEVISLGAANNLTGYQAKCKLNDIRIYDHALSPLEVKQISQGLILHYPLNNNGFGQENLLPCGGQYTKNNPWSTTLNKTDGYAWVTNSAFQAIPSTTYTISVECDGTLSDRHAKGSIPISDKPFTFWLYICNIDTSKSWKSGAHDSAINLTSANYNYKKIGNVHTWQYTLSSTQKYISLRTNSYSDGSTNITINWWNMKIEKGDVFTSWCPNSTDELATTLGLNDNIEYDCSGFNRNGEKININYSSDTPKYDVSSVFSASPSVIKIPNSNYAIQGSQNMTISIWAYKDDWSQFSERVYSCTEGGGLNIQPTSSGQIEWAVNVYTDAEKTSHKYDTNLYIRIPKTEFSSGWHMFTWTYTTSGTSLYIDGILKQSKLGTSYGICFHSTAPLILGGQASGSSYTSPYLNGKLSDFRIYTTALSTEDILALYKNSAYIDNQGNIYGAELREV